MMVQAARNLLLPESWRVIFSHLPNSMSLLFHYSELLQEMKGKKIMFYGPNSKKTSEVVIDALRLSKETDLTEVTLLFCGDKSDFERIEKEAESFEGDLIFVEHP